MTTRSEKIRLSLAIILPIAVLLVWLIAKGGIVLDHSAERDGQGVHWNGTHYIPCSGEYDEGKTLAKTDDGWEINEVKQDPSHTFIVLRSFLDQYLLVSQDYSIPTAGDITLAHWGIHSFDDATLLATLSTIIDQATVNFQYRINDLAKLNTPTFKSLHVGYEDCPVATQRVGSIGTIDGVWYLTVSIPPKPTEDGTYTVGCYAIPQEYTAVLEDYFQ